MALDWEIRPYQQADLTAWLRMRMALWPELAADPHAEEDARQWLARPDAVLLVAASALALIGFAEVGERPYADGCDSSPVAFLEAWFVMPEMRGNGVGAGLVQAAESWARSRGLTEFASDALLENETACAAHLSLGFAEVERAIRFRKPLLEVPLA